MNSHSFATYGLSLGLTFGTLVSGFPGGMQLIVLIGADGAMRSSDLWVRRRFLFPCLRGHAVCLHVFALGTHGPSRKPTMPASATASPSFGVQVRMGGCEGHSVQLWVNGTLSTACKLRVRPNPQQPK